MCLKILPVSSFPLALSDETLFNPLFILIYTPVILLSLLNTVHRGLKVPQCDRCNLDSDLLVCNHWRTVLTEPGNNMPLMDNIITVNNTCFLIVIRFTQCYWHTFGADKAFTHKARSALYGGGGVLTGTLTAASPRKLTMQIIQRLDGFPACSRVIDQVLA